MNAQMKIKVFCFLLILSLAAAPQFLQAAKKSAKGVVFLDANNNGIFDTGEKGIPGVVVSNQKDAVQTDENGRYRIPITKETIIFISKPAGYNIPRDENNLPKYFYIHQPKGSPAGLKFNGIAPTGKLPRSIDFPLLKGETKDSFSAIIMGDPQTKKPEEVDYYRDDIITGLIGTTADFYLALGDIMYDDLNLYPRMNRVVGQLGIPVYHVPGNHDTNYRVPDHNNANETFRRFYGPDYYSFNVGKVHFVSLNTVKYKGWNKEENKSKGYTGYVHEKQLTWLKNDLSFVPQDHLVVLTMHIPISTEQDEKPATMVTNREALFEVLKNRKHLLALAGHMHFVEYMEFGPEQGWTGDAVFPSLTAGAGCGTWWHGPKSPAGLPLGLGTDGTPNGHFLFTFEGNRYTYRFYPGSTSPDEQMRINSPSGTLDPQELEGMQINVNVFAGTPRTIVTCELDNGTPFTMERTVMNDPFFQRLVKENKDAYIDWMKPVESFHTWTAPLPGNLAEGIHRLKVTVKDHQGFVFTAYKLFEVLPQ